MSHRLTREMFLYEVATASTLELSSWVTRWVNLAGSAMLLVSYERVDPKFDIQVNLQLQQHVNSKR